MNLVLDCSAVLAWVHGDECTPEIEAVFGRVVEEGAVVPNLWHLEVANALTVAVRRKRVSQEFRDGVLKDLGELVSLPIAIRRRMLGELRCGLRTFTALPSMTPPIWNLRSGLGCRSRRSMGIWRRLHAQPALRCCHRDDRGKDRQT